MAIRSGSDGSSSKRSRPLSSLQPPDLADGAPGPALQRAQAERADCPGTRRRTATEAKAEEGAVEQVGHERSGGSVGRLDGASPRRCLAERRRADSIARSSMRRARSSMRRARASTRRCFPLTKRTIRPPISARTPTQNSTDASRTSCASTPPQKTRVARWAALCSAYPRAFPQEPVVPSTITVRGQIMTSAAKPTRPRPIRIASLPRLTRRDHPTAADRLPENAKRRPATGRSAAFDSISSLPRAVI